MSEDQIRKIVDDEIQKKLFRYPKIPPHKHDGVDNINISQTSIIPITSSMGLITFAHIGTFTLYFNSLGATRVDLNGFVLNSGVTIYGLIVGNAILSSAYYFQPNNTSSVITGGPKYPIIGPTLDQDSPRIAQCSSSLTIDQSDLSKTFPSFDQFRIIFADSSGGILVSGYLNNIQKDSVDVIIEVLASGFTLNANITIT